MGCVICGSDACEPSSPAGHLASYPFLPGGRPEVSGVEGVDYVRAPVAVYDRTPGVERCVYGAGDRVPMVDAVRYGLAVEVTGDGR